MAYKFRRVVTGHDADGKAVIDIDETVEDLSPLRPGANAAVAWSTKGFPVDNNDPTDGRTRKVGTSEPDGTVFRIIEYEPGVAPRNHRTLSIDYAVVLSGEICMRLDDTEVELRAGDVLVQRGTIHNWVNRGSESCVIAFVLIDARPVQAASGILEPSG